MTGKPPPRASLDLPSRGPEERFERVTSLARRLLDVPVATLCFLEDGRMWVKSGPGAGEPDMPREGSLLGRVHDPERVVALEDAALDPELAGTPEVHHRGVRSLATHPLTGPDGDCLGLLAVLDVRPRRFDPDELDRLADLAALAEGALRRSALEQWRRAGRELTAVQRFGVEGPDWLFEHSLDLLVIAGFDGYFKQISPSWERTLGWSPAELLGRPYVDFVHPDDVQRTFEEQARLGAGSDTQTFQNRYRCRGGGYRWLHWKAHPSFERRAIYAVARDITDAKRAEEDLRRAMETAEAASRAKSDFLATMSHEFRTPLNSILGFTKLLLRRPEQGIGEVERDYLRRVHTSGLYLLDLVNSILDLSRVESGHNLLAREPVDVGRVVGDVVAGLEALAVSRGLRLEKDVPAELEPILTDGARLEQILINLLGNALKFTERGTVSVHVEPAPGTRAPLRVRVRDTGIGIPADRLEQIFEPFEQVESGPARQYEGTGLGLAIARSLAERLGHRLHVASRLGQGSTFTLDLAPER